MPNHVRNVIKMQGIIELPLFRAYDDGSKGFDFNKMIPMTDGAVRIYGCTITTVYGKQKAKNGDYIVCAADGSIFPVKKSKFKSQYERAEK